MEPKVTALAQGLQNEHCEKLFKINKQNRQEVRGMKIQVNIKTMNMQIEKQ